MSAPLTTDEEILFTSPFDETRNCECETGHVGPICNKFNDDDTGICMNCEHEEACHEYPK